MLDKIGAAISKNRRFIPLVATAVLALTAYGIGAIFLKGLREPQVFLNIFRANSFILISAIGMTFVILTKGIDLSVSGVMALTTVAAAALLRDGWNAWIVILLMLAMGMALGAIMGSFIAYMKVQPFIATLAGMWFARGMSFFISDDAIAIHNRIYTLLGQTKILIPGLTELAVSRGDNPPFISISTVVAFVVLGIAIYVAHYTRFGRTVYAIGGNEQSARLMGLPVNITLVLVYTLSGFCSALAGITLSIFVSSGHGLYATGFELDVIASVVMGGTMLSGGSGYVFGTLFGVLILGITQTLIQFNGSLSSWWTRIVIGALTFMFIGVQSVLAARKGGRRKAGEAGAQSLAAARRRRRMLAFGGSGAIVVALLAIIFIPKLVGPGNGTSTQESDHCQYKPFRQDQAAKLIEEGAVITWETNGGPRCVDNLYAIYPDGRIIGDDGVNQIEKQVTPADVDILLAGISNYGWFTDEMYDTWHTPCGQCSGHYVTVSYNGQEKTVKGVDGGTDAPADYWQAVSLIRGIVPKFTSAP
jgi:ribose/xylose/arabinose/galactoside ABC-type transport system permease subunit